MNSKQNRSSCFVWKSFTDNRREGRGYRSYLCPSIYVELGSAMLDQIHYIARKRWLVWVSASSEC